MRSTKKIIGNFLFATCMCAVVLLSNEATASVIYRLSGTVIEAPDGALPDVGDVVFGFVELSDRAFADSPPYEFALGRGDVLEIEFLDPGVEAFVFTFG